MVDKDKEEEYSWEMATHLAALAGVIGVPFGNILGPLFVWLIKKDQFESVNIHGKESLNFQISMTIYLLLSALLLFFIVGFFLVAAIIIIDIVFIIKAAAKASNGELYRYPCTIRFLK
ncbi:MAG: DUF4870 domain-containing protein [Chlamydiales bacterium]|nr:DUF4870 domain-containing protein [Chlamydiales bacterium]